MNKREKNPALQAAGKKGASVRYGQDYGGPRLEDMPRDAEGKIPDLRAAGRRAAEIKYSRQRMPQGQQGQTSQQSTVQGFEGQPQNPMNFLAPGASMNPTQPMINQPMNLTHQAHGQQGQQGFQPPPSGFQ